MSKTKFKPLHDRVLIERVEGETKTAGGIYIPDSAKDKPIEGKVVATGEGKWIDGTVKPLTVKVGDKVLFSKYAETEVKIGGDTFLILREDDLLGVIS